MKLFEGMTETRKAELVKQLRAEWSHDSTAIEGNTLSLGETMFVLEYGLTVKGKPLKDQVDVLNHARAVDCVMEIFSNGVLTEEDVFRLHRLVINEQSSDIYKPIGAYKRENNGTYRVGTDGHSVYHAYLPADEVPHAMQEWIADFNRSREPEASSETLVALYARLHLGFTAIHPFFEGNGRLARLLANIPVLSAGYPPIIIPSEAREDYLKALWCAEEPSSDIEPFKALIRSSWTKTLELFKGAASPGA